MASTPHIESIPAEIPAGRVFRLTPDRVLVGVWVLFWVLMIIISIEDHWGNPAISWWEPLVWEGTSALTASVLWFIIWRRLLERHDDEPVRWLLRMLAGMPLASVAFLVSTFALRHGIYALLGLRYHHESWGFVWLYESVKFCLFFGLWGGVFFGLRSFTLWREREAGLQRLQKTLAEAQLAHLKAQLRPHFLFNALNTVSAVMHTDVARADRLLTKLADLLRASLTWSERDVVTLEEELRVLALYATIMEERFADRVTLDWQIAPETHNAQIPTLLLQPILENAFKHGVEGSARGERITISARRQGDLLAIDISNTVARAVKFTAQSAGMGVGVRNCRERLQLIYAGRATFDLTDMGGEVRASLRLPWRAME
jgi:hypothetical protein